MKFKVDDANVFAQEDVVMMIFRNSQHSFYIEDDLTNNKTTADNYLLKLDKESCNGGITSIEINDAYLKFELNDNAQQKLTIDAIEIELDLERCDDLKKELQTFAKAYKIFIKK